MTSAANLGQGNAALREAVTTWRDSVDRLQLLVDRKMQEGCLQPSPSDHDDFAAALRALYALEAAFFLMDEADLQKAA